MAKLTKDMVHTPTELDTSADGTIVPKADSIFSTVLDVTDFADSVIVAGHIIVETAEGVYKPQAVSNGVYTAIASGESYAGVLNGSIYTSDQIAAVAQVGIVNENACKYAPLAAAKTALSFIHFTSDK